MLQKADVAEVLAAEGRRSRRGRVVGLAVIAALVLIVAGGGAWWWAGWRNSAVSAYTTDPVVLGTVTGLRSNMAASA